jgi:hypothetical protein
MVSLVFNDELLLKTLQRKFNDTEIYLSVCVCNIVIYFFIFKNQNCEICVYFKKIHLSINSEINCVEKCDGEFNFFYGMGVNLIKQVNGSERNHARGPEEDEIILVYIGKYKIIRSAECLRCFM